MRLKHVIRRLLQRPGFTSAAVFTLALGIGANTAVFSVLEGVLLKPLEYPHSDELVALEHAAPAMNVTDAGAAPFLYFTYREDGRTLEDVGLWQVGRTSLTGFAQPEEVPTLRITDGILPLLRVQPMLGRLITKVDDAPGSPETVVLTAGYWRSKFGADPSVVGRSITLDGRPREIIGVLPDSFRFLDRRVSLVQPLRLDRSRTFLGSFNYNGIGRLKPGVSLAAAQTDLARLMPAALVRFPPVPGFSAKSFEEARLQPSLRLLKSDLVGSVQTVLWVLMGTIAIVLLIACANVANLLLVRADSRQQELAIRASLGAGWGRIARELLLESMTLALAGGIAALVLAAVGIRALKALAPQNLPRVEGIAIDAGVLLFTLLISLAAGLLFGAVPIFKYARPHVGALRGIRTASASKERHRVRSALVVAQVALALVLLVSSGLMIRTFQSLRRVQPGFTSPEQIQTVRLTIPASQVRDPLAVMRMEQAIADRIAAISGVTSVGLTTVVPLEGDGWHDPIMVEDHVYAPNQMPTIRLFKFVSPGLVATMGNRIVAGRDLTWSDLYEQHAVAMISENLARELWQQPTTALGKRIRENPNSDWREIVGVVGDEHDDGLHKPATAAVYWPALMSKFTLGRIEGLFGNPSLAYIIRSPRTGSSGFVDEISRAVWSINPNLPVARARTLQDVYDGSLARTSFTLVMLAIAGAIALLLGVAGVYGVIAYSVTQRTREIGIRMALGARAGAVLRMFVGHGLALTGIGVAIGAAAAAATMRLLSSLLYDVSPVDPPTYIAVALVLVFATVTASYVPALRATSIDPADALRAD